MVASVSFTVYSVFSQYDDYGLINNVTYTVTAGVYPSYTVSVEGYYADEMAMGVVYVMGTPIMDVYFEQMPNGHMDTWYGGHT